MISDWTIETVEKVKKSNPSGIVYEGTVHLEKNKSGKTPRCKVLYADSIVFRVKKEDKMIFISPGHFAIRIEYDDNERVDFAQGTRTQWGKIQV